MTAKLSFRRILSATSSPLRNSFPTLYEMDGSKGAMMADLKVEGRWNFRFERTLNDWKMGTIQRFLYVISQRRINPLSRDRLLWKRSVNGPFSVSLALTL